MTLQPLTAHVRDPAAAVTEQALPLLPLPVVHASNTIPSQDMVPATTIWIGYTKNGHHYLDQQSKAQNTEQQVQALKVYYEKRFSRFERFVMRWVYCQMLIVQVGELHSVSGPTNSVPPILISCKQILPSTHTLDVLPRQVRFDPLEVHSVLSAGLLRPELLQESGDMFHETDVFDRKAHTAVGTQSVLCISYAMNKKLLVGPLVLTSIVVVVVAVVVGYVTRSVATAAEVGSFVGVFLTLIWSYVLWVTV
jgi:hypothetical protein